MGDYDSLRAERDFNMNPPNSSPGQGSMEDSWGDLFPEGSSSVDNGDMGFVPNTTDVNTVLNGQLNNGNQNQQNPQPTSMEDWVIQMGAKAGIGIFNWIKSLSVALYHSVTNNSETDWHFLGVRITKISAGVFFTGFILLLLSPIITIIHNTQVLMCAGILSGIIGIFTMMRNNVNPDEVRQKEEIINEEPESNDFDFGGESLFDGEFDFEDEPEPEEEFVEDDSIWDSVLEGTSDLFDDSIEGCTIGSPDFDVSTAVSEVQEIPAGTQTRQYLFETFCKVLPRMNPDFSSMEQVSEDSDEFMMYVDYLQSSAIQAGTKDENIPNLLEVRKNLFIIQLRAERPYGLKEQEIADLIADLYSRDEDNNVVRFGVYATVDSTVGLFIINIFTGNSAMISLSDVYSVIGDYVKDPKITMPFVWGINELGKPLYCDLANCDSIIISGEARSGKSWKGQSIVAQLCMFNSPKELEFYIFDPKDYASDYRFLSNVLPHVKYFCGDSKKINSGIKRVTEKALQERTKIFAEAGVLNIKDYNANHPNDKLSYMYILIDELMGLTASYDKDEQAEFKSLMSTIVSKLPYLGIRLILFPHRIVDNVIGKNIYSLVSSRAVVRQLNADEVKNAVNVTKKEFPYSLVNNGDMALKTKEIANGMVVFCHAEVLTRDNDTNKDLFRFIGSVWNKLEPDCEGISFTGSIGGRITINGQDETGRKSAKLVTPPKDNTDGQDLFEYQGYSSGEDAFDLSTEEVTDTSEEDFWSEVLEDE